MRVPPGSVRRNRRGFGDARCRTGEGFERRLKAIVDHARADVGPARGLVLLGQDRSAVRERAADGFLKRVEVEHRLLFQAVVEELADLEELVDRLVDLLFAAALGQRIDDQGIELGVLRFFHPVMLHQALEQRVEVAVVADRAEIMLLRHPLDHQDNQPDRERIVAQYLGADIFGRADHWHSTGKPRTNAR